MAPILNDPGVYIIEDPQPRANELQLPDMPAGFIGPLFQIADQDSVTKTSVTLDEAMMNDISNQSSVMMSYPSLADSENSVDVESVQVELVKRDGRREEVPEIVEESEELVTISPTEVTLNLGDETTGDAYQYFKDLNDAWLGKKVDYTEPDPDWSGLANAAVHINFRSLREDLIGRVLEVQGAADAQILLGKGTLDNPLGLAGMIATNLVGNQAHYFVPTEDYLTDVGDNNDEAAAISQALGLLESKRVHGITALSPNSQTHQTVLNHCNNMSTVEEKMYRLTWTYKSIPTEEEVMEDQGLDPLNDEISTIELKSGQVDMLHQYGKSISNELCRVLYQDFIMEIDGEDVEVPGYYLSAMYNAFRVGIPSQQGLTNYPVGGIVKELKYQKGYFKPSQLRRLSEGGIFVVLQDVADAPVKARAQWTTNMLNNTTKQDSLIYSRHDYYYGLIDALNPLIGVNNVSDSIMETIIETIDAYNNARREERLINNAEVADISVNPDDESRVDVIEDVEFSTPLDKIVNRIRY